MTSGALVQGYLRHHGDRLKADIDAKRRILGWAQTGALPDYEIEYVLTSLALPYADREGYKESWRP
jgi:hypothetical protein